MTGLLAMIASAKVSAGAGAVDSAPKFNVLFLASAFAETITPTTGPVEYDLISDRATMDSGSMYFNVDGVRHALLGLRGSVRLDFKANDIPHVHFTGLGLWVLPADIALPTPTFTGWQEGLEVNSTNTPTFTIHGYSGELSELTVDLANQLAPRFLVGSESIRIGDRAPVGSCLISAPLMATKNFFDIAEKETLGALQIIHGTADGNIIQLDAPKVQIIDVGYEDGEGDLMLRLGLKLIPDTGDDELKITTK